MSSTAASDILTTDELFANPALRSYLSNVRDWHGYIRFLGLPDRRDHPDIIVDRLFVAPLFMDRYISPDETPGEWIGEAKTLMNALTIDKRMVLLGDPGTGKSALVNYLVWLLSRPAENGLVARIGWHLPVPMVLRDLRLEGVTDFNSLLQAFLKHAMSAPLRNATFLHEMLESGRGFILLDGIDEIGNIEARKNLRQSVMDGFDRYPDCRWLLTSRIVGYEDVPFGIHDGTSGDDGFWTGNGHILGRMSDLSVKRSRVAVPPGVVTRYIAPFDDRRIEAFARRWYEVRDTAAVRAGEQAARFVEAVHADEGILRLARIPHLLTMMALIHRIEATLPQERTLLYDRIAEAYLESIDKFRGIYTGAADLPFKKRWLARIGLEMQRRRDMQKIDRSEILVDSTDVLGWVRDEMKRHPSTGTDTPEEFLRFVKQRSGLLLPRGENRYAFIHLSFQEYFAAHALKREITTPTWIREGNSPLEFDSKSLSDWAKTFAWTETFVFLFEMLSPEEDWHDDLRDLVFGKNFLHLCETADSIFGLNVLVASVVNSRRSRFRSSDILDAICSQNSRDKISDLSLAMLQISDLNPISCLTSLQTLSLDGTQVSDLSPLARLTSLQTLSLDGTQVSDLSLLVRLTSLHTLWLDDTEVSDMAPLANLTSLQTLSLERTEISVLDPLARLNLLQRLWLDDTEVSDLTPLADLASLQILSLNGTQVSDLMPLADLDSLRCLLLDETQISDLTPLADLTSLGHLSLDGTQVSDLTPLTRFTSLHILLLRETQVSDLTPLTRLTSLQYLSLHGTQVSDLTPLARLTSLQYLSLHGTQVSDLAPIFRLTSLEYIDIERTNVSETTVQGLRKTLPNCIIAYQRTP